MLVGDKVYIQKYNVVDSEEEYIYYCSRVYDIKNENGKEYVYSMYPNVNIKFKMLKEDIYVLNGKYYINMPKYQQF